MDSSGSEAERKNIIMSPKLTMKDKYGLSDSELCDSSSEDSVSKKNSNSGRKKKEI